MSLNKDRTFKCHVVNFTKIDYRQTFICVAVITTEKLMQENNYNKTSSLNLKFKFKFWAVANKIKQMIRGRALQFKSRGSQNLQLAPDSKML